LVLRDCVPPGPDSAAAAAAAAGGGQTPFAQECRLIKYIKILLSH
jgi:hypothetical protein